MPRNAPQFFVAGESRNSTPSAKARGKSAFAVNYREGIGIRGGSSACDKPNFYALPFSCVFWELGGFGYGQNAVGRLCAKAGEPGKKSDGDTLRKVPVTLN